jgi:hypothetical protein
MKEIASNDAAIGDLEGSGLFSGQLNPLRWALT